MRACTACRASGPPGWRTWCTCRGPSGPRRSVRVTPGWLARAGIIVERLDDPDSPVAAARRPRGVLAVTAAAAAGAGLMFRPLLVLAVLIVAALALCWRIAARRRSARAVPAPGPRAVLEQVTTVNEAALSCQVSGLREHAPAQVKS